MVYFENQNNDIVYYNVVKTLLLGKSFTEEKSSRDLNAIARSLWDNIIPETSASKWCWDYLGGGDIVTTKKFSVGQLPNTEFSKHLKKVLGNNKLTSLVIEACE